MALDIERNKYVDIEIGRNSLIDFVARFYVIDRYCSFYTIDEFVMMHVTKRNDAIVKTKVKHEMTRKTNTNNIVFPCVLKTIIAHTYRDNKTFTLNDKQIRAKIRANENAIKTTSHVKNTSHVAHNMTQYNALRCAFDIAYANALTQSRKRNAKKNDTSNVVENVDA